MGSAISVKISNINMEPRRADTLRVIAELISHRLQNEGRKPRFRERIRIFANRNLLQRHLENRFKQMSERPIGGKPTPMNQNLNTQSGIFNPRALAAVALCAGGVFLTILSLAVGPPAKQSAAVNSTATGSVGNWEIVPAPSATDTMQKNYPSGITCVSTSECWSVGIDTAY